MDTRKFAMNYGAVLGLFLVAIAESSGVDISIETGSSFNTSTSSWCSSEFEAHADTRKRENSAGAKQFKCFMLES